MDNKDLRFVMAVEVIDNQGGEKLVDISGNYSNIKMVEEALLRAMRLLKLYYQA